MLQPHSRHLFSSDDLFDRVIEDEVDRANPALHPEKRHACIRQVKERMAGAIQEHLKGADLSPDSLIVELRQEVTAALDAFSGGLAA